MINTIIFDIGLVLVNWHPVLNKIFPPDTADAVQAAIFESGLWDELDKGIEDDEAIIERMIALAPDFKEQIEYILHNLDLLAEQFDYSKEWITTLKNKGYHVYFLSNYSRLLRNVAPALTDFTPLMDGGIFSADVKLVKPDPRIYKLLLQRYNLNASECLFIDDRQINVDAAIACGMKACLFTGNSLEEILSIIKSYD